VSTPAIPLPTQVSPELDLAHNAIAELTTERIVREEFLDRTLVVLRDAGFDRVRYYERTVDVATGDELLVLVRENDGEGAHAGFTVALRESSLWNEGRLSETPVIDYAAGDADTRNWLGDLGLLGRAWVELPVTAGADMVGIIACDWRRGSNFTLTEEHCLRLRTIGALVGSYLGLKPIALLDDYRAQRSRWTADNPAGFVCDALPYLAGVVDAAAAAVFEFNWTDQTLTRLDQHIAAPLRARAGQLEPFEETYQVGEYLTGAAWNIAGVHHIVSFDSVRDHLSQQIAPDSEKWHSELLGTMRSLMYLVVGEVDRRFLFRFVNRLTQPAVPFVYAKTVLETIASELCADVDSALTAQRSTALQGMASLTVESTRLGALVEQVGLRLRAEAVHNFAIVCHQQQTTQFKFIAYCGPRMKRVDIKDSSRWADDGLYRRARRLGGPGVDRLSDADRRGTLTSALRGRGFRGALTIPIESGGTLGIMIIPLDSIAGAPSGSSSLTFPPGCGYGTSSMLLAYGRLIANAVESGDAGERVDAALKALGLMGHELRAPIARLGSAAEEVIGFGEDVAFDLQSLDPERAAELNMAVTESQKTIDDALRAVDVVLEFAPFVAKDSNRLELVFDDLDLRSILRDAIVDVEQEITLDKSGRRYTFSLKDSVGRLEATSGPPFNGDRHHLRVALKNVIRNAAKYSLPRWPELPMDIEIFGEATEAELVVKIRNWGHGIPGHERHLIFEPWVRGSVNDRLKAIGGMGIGLHLARHIVAAHKGEMRVTSESTLDDPERNRRMEGFLTTFELRLSRGLDEGKYIYHQDGVLEGPFVDGNLGI
jgi:signal transduction histidine kinase